MPDTPTPMSDIESIRKDLDRAAAFAGGDEVDLVEYGWERINLAGNPPDYWYAHSMLMPCEPGEEVTLDRAMTIQAAEIMERLASHCRTLLSQLAIAREETLDDCRNACLDIDLDSYRGHDRHTADEVMELVFSAIRSLSHTQQSTRKEQK